jgi:hypothetical protein
MLTKRAERCRRKFLRYFPGGFSDETYTDWERDYKWQAHRAWQAQLGPREYRRLLTGEHYGEIATRALRIESRTNLLFSFEKMALRDAVRTPLGAMTFAIGLHEFLHGRGSPERRFGRWCEMVRRLPRKQTRVVTWPVTTVFGFMAQPDRHMFLKPNVTRKAAATYGFDFLYQPKPAWPTYASLLAFADRVMADQKDLQPHDLIDAQSFIWVQGSDEY